MRSDTRSRKRAATLVAHLAAIGLAAPAAAQPTEQPPAIATPAERIPLDRMKLPAGFQIELWAHGLPGARAMARGDLGTIFVATGEPGRVYAVSDKGGRRESRVVADGLTQPTGVAFRGKSLYVAAIDRVLRYDDIETRPDSPPLDLSKAFNLPADNVHGARAIAVGPDGKLYVAVGAPCNVCYVDDETHAHIRRYDPDGAGMEIVAVGVRHSLGLDFHPRTGELWFTDSGRSPMDEHRPEDELNRLPAIGADFGFPYCHERGLPDHEVERFAQCSGVTMPLALLGHDAGARGLRFYAGAVFPAEYRERVFIARAGAADVVSVVVAPDGSARVEPFLAGLVDAQAGRIFGRPADVLAMPDGALLVSDEHNGAIYRISWHR